MGRANGFLRFVALVFLFLLLSLTLSAQEPATVEGIVVKQGTTEPIQGAVVSFTPLTGAAKTATSGEDGKFTLANLTPGRYQVTATRTGFVKARRGSGPSNLSLVAGQRLTGINVQLAPTGVITGRVLDENGMPKAGVSVYALRPEYQNGQRVMPCYGSGSGNARTNEAGAYRLFGLEAGDYYIVSTLGATCGEAYYPGVFDPADSVALSIRPGAELGGIDIREKETPRYSARFKLEGPPPISTSASSKRVQILRITRGLAVNQFVSIGIGLGGETYITPKLLPGSYEIYYDNGLGVQIGRAKFDLVDRDIDAGSIVFKPGIALPGRLQVPNGLPAGWAFNRARVNLRPLDLRDRIMTVTLNTLSTAAADGTFLIAFAANRDSTERPGTVAEGRYQISLTGLVEDQYLASAKYGATDVLDTGLLVDGVQPGPIELTILNGGTVDGIVRNAKDEPVPDSRVVIVPAPSHRGNFNLYKTGSTDQFGRFSLRGVAPGEYGVLAWEDVENGAWESADFLKDYETRATRVSVSAASASNATIRVIPAREEGK